MGRPRLPGNEHLPERVTFYHGAYYYLPKNGSRTRLARTLEEMIPAWRKVAARPGDLRTMNAVFDKYLLDVTPNKNSPWTRHDDERAVPYLRAFCGHMAPEEIEAATAYEYLDTRGKVARTRANREFSVLSNVMTFAVRWKLVPFNPLIGVQKLEEKPRDREVRPEEVLAWYRFAGPFLGAYTSLKLLIGLRKADMLRLRIDAWSPEGLFSPHGKTGRRLLYERTPALCHCVTRAISRCSHDTTLVFATREGESYVDDEGRTDSFDSIWQRRMAKFVEAGYERFTEHDLRSKAGDDAEEAGGTGHKLLGNTEGQFRRAYQRRTRRIRPVR
jgi:integrase